MLSLTADSVRMQATASTKDEALLTISEILHADGLTQSDYFQGLKDRENQSSTYLGQGIAIPHGTPNSRSSVLKTGVRLVHFADGVKWNDAGDMVYLAVAIAAQSDEHLQILQSLTRALGDDIADKIRTAATADEIIDALGATSSLAIQDGLIKTDSTATSTDELYLQAVQLLKTHGMIQSLFLPTHQPTALSQAVSCVVLEEGARTVIGESALAVVANQQQALAVITATDKVDRNKLSTVLDVLMDDDFANAVLANNRKAMLNLLGVDSPSDWATASVVLANEHGLHARPATALSELAKEVSGEIKVAVDHGAYVSAKSLTRLLSLGAVKGQTLNFIAEPATDAVAHLPRLIEAVQAGLGEVVSAPSASAGDTLADIATPSTEMIANGIKHYAVSASQGLAVGEAYIAKDERHTYPMTAQIPSEEMTKLLTAIEAVKADLKELVANAKNADIAQIFTAHIALLEDEEVIYGAKDGMDDGLSAPAAWHAFIEQLAKTQASLNNHLLAERAQDLRDIGQKVLLKLLGKTQKQAPQNPYVLIKEDLVPSDVANLDPTRVAGIITAVGGASSHSAIVARALGIPAIVGAGQGILEIGDATQVLLDGGEGWFVVEPSQTLISDCQEAQVARREQKRLAVQHAAEPAITTDGHRVEIAANLGNVADTANAVANGAEGVGLLRTELVFMSHSQVPDIDTQIADYEQVFDALDGRPLVVRVLDIGGDKALPYLPMPSEENPFLGLRGIRLLLERPDFLRSQLTALIRASRGRDLRIMFPMIGRIEEWRAARKILDEVLAEYPHDNLQVGIMLEVPSAAVMVDHFAKEVDFFSVGTNDLTQYVLAIDRGHPLLSKDADGLHPSVLRLIAQTVTAAHAHGKWVGVCGELASDPKAVPILIGLGVDELSMSGSSIALTKAQVRTINYESAKVLAKQALECESAKQVRALQGASS